MARADSSHGLDATTGSELVKKLIRGSATTSAGLMVSICAESTARGAAAAPRYESK
jgi:F0F1-type ATP synthase membrane subunit c/vacuolar-type H+-ATPase subunit K